MSPRNKKFLEKKLRKLKGKLLPCALIVTKQLKKLIEMEI